MCVCSRRRGVVMLTRAVVTAPRPEQTTPQFRVAESTSRHTRADTLGSSAISRAGAAQKTVANPNEADTHRSVAGNKELISGNP